MYKITKERYPIGMIINDMTVIGYDTTTLNMTTINCKCNICGKEKLIRPSDLRNQSGSTSHKYCNRNKYNHYNGLSTLHPRLFRIWRAIIDRIYNTNDSRYKDYGGRGLKCDYNDFETFVRELGQSYYEHVEKYGELDTSIDRIDNRYGYIRGNLRWATKKEQVLNRECMKRCFLAFAPTGEVYLSNNQSYFAKTHNINRASISNCLANRQSNTYGWKFQYSDCLFLPKNVIYEIY